MLKGGSSSYEIININIKYNNCYWKGQYEAWPGTLAKASWKSSDPSSQKIQILGKDMKNSYEVHLKFI